MVVTAFVCLFSVCLFEALLEKTVQCLDKRKYSVVKGGSAYFQDPQKKGLGS